MPKLTGKFSRLMATFLLAAWVSVATSFALYVGPPWQAAGAAAVAAPLIPWLVLAMQRRQESQSPCPSETRGPGKSENRGTVDLRLLVVAVLLLACGFGLALSGIAGDGSYLERLSEALVAVGTLMAVLALIRCIARVSRPERVNS